MYLQKYVLQESNLDIYKTSHYLKLIISEEIIE